MRGSWFGWAFVQSCYRGIHVGDPIIPLCKKFLNQNRGSQGFTSHSLFFRRIKRETKEEHNWNTHKPEEKQRGTRRTEGNRFDYRSILAVFCLKRTLHWNTPKSVLNQTYWSSSLRFPCISLLAFCFYLCFPSTLRHTDTGSEIDLLLGTPSLLW